MHKSKFMTTVDFYQSNYYSNYLYIYTKGMNKYLGPVIKEVRTAVKATGEVHKAGE